MWPSDNPDSTGRWRDDPADSTVKYAIDGKKLLLPGSTVTVPVLLTLIH